MGVAKHANNLIQQIRKGYTESSFCHTEAIYFREEVRRVKYSVFMKIAVGKLFWPIKEIKTSSNSHTNIDC